MSRIDLHNHSIHSDGNNTIEEMVLSALRDGLDVFGISDHSFTSFDTSYCMQTEDYPLYMNEINALKEKYRGQVRILAGIEMDYFTEEIPKGLDYVIGSVHFIRIDDAYLPIDLSTEEFQRIGEDVFDGDFLALCRAYYETVADVVNRTDCDIIGHFDLVSKFNEGNRFFDEDSEEYRKMWQEALLKLLPFNRLFEVNYGAYDKGLRKRPYLTEEMQQFVKEKGGRIINSSDSHTTKPSKARSFDIII